MPFHSPGDLPYPEIECGSPALQADSLPSEPPGKPLIKASNKNIINAKKKKKISPKKKSEAVEELLKLNY